TAALSCLRKHPRVGGEWMKVLKGILLGGILVAAGPALAEDDVAELQALKARLKQLEQRLDNQARKQEVLAAKQDSRLPVKASPFDPCPAGKVCVKGVAFTFGGWVDLTGIYRSRNLASDTGSVYNFIPYPQARNYYTGESRFSARQSRFSVLAEADA